jgi:hypothetical protein
MPDTVESEVHRAQELLMLRKTATPTLEVLPLEDRTVPAVIASVVGGNLIVVGDAADDRIQIVRNGECLEVRSIWSDTTVNGVLGGSFLAPLAVHNVEVYLGSGNDLLWMGESSRVRTPIRGDIKIRAGQGNDSVSFYNVEVTGKGDIQTGNGSDGLWMGATKFEGTVEANMGTGDDRVLLGRAGVRNDPGDPIRWIGNLFESNARFDLGAGEDSFVMLYARSGPQCVIAVNGGPDDDTFIGYNGNRFGKLQLGTFEDITLDPGSHYRQISLG